MRCEVKDGSEHLVLDPHQLEDEVRDGRVTLDAEVRLVDGGDVPVDPDGWPTDGGWHRVRSIPALKGPADAPGARLGARLRRRVTPWATLALIAVLLAVGAASELGADALGPRFRSLCFGFVPSLVDGGWWTPWTAALLHVGPFHLLANLPVIAYCGWRVERAAGPAGVAGVCAGAVLVATPLVVALSDVPVVGASTLAFGLLGAQVGLGLRLGDALPAGHRSPYGWGNLVFSLPLVIQGLGRPGISDLAHVGGLLGGLAAAMVLPLASTAPATHAGRATARALALAAVVAVAPMAGVAVAARLPDVLGWPSHPVSPPDTGLTLHLPDRLAEHPLVIGGVPAWSISGDVDAPFFAGLLRVSRDAVVDEALRGWWARVLGTDVEPVGTEPSAVGEAWQLHRLRAGPFGGFPDGATITAHVLARGRYAWIVGWVVGDDHAASPGLDRWFGGIAATAQVGDPPSVAEARARWSNKEDDPKYRYDLAVELLDAGVPAEAHALVAPLLGRDDGWAWDALRVALAAWEQDPTLAIDADQLVRRADETPAYDLTLLRPGFDWLVAHGDCAAATRITAKIAALGREAPEDLDADDVARLLELAETQQASLQACAR